MRSRRVLLLAFALVALVATACGSSDSTGFDTPRGAPPADPSEWTKSVPSEEMTEEAEALLVREGHGITSAECEPTESLDGTGEYNFRCDAVRRGFAVQLTAIVFGSASGDPTLGPIIVYD